MSRESTILPLSCFTVDYIWLNVIDFINRGTLGTKVSFLNLLDSTLFIFSCAGGVQSSSGQFGLNGGWGHQCAPDTCQGRDGEIHAEQGAF